MSIADQITRLQTAKQDIINAIKDKGVDVPSGAVLAELPRYIRDISYYVIGGRSYRTVTIGDVTWLAENLDFQAIGISIGPSGAPSTPAAWYYNNDEATYGVNGNKYGLLYNWYAVKLLNDNRADLIPGWHVPSKAEWDALATAVGGASVAGTHLKSTTGWRSGAGSDDFSFSAFPSGYRYTGGSFGNIGTDAIFWTATEDASSNACAIAFDPNVVMTSSYRSNASGSAVRLVRD